MANILLIEDDPSISNAYAWALAHTGYHVILASRGSQALDIIEHQTFDILLLDLLMPELGGLEFLERGDFHQRFPQTKIIILTTVENPKLKERAASLGALHYLIKVEYTPYGLARSLAGLLKSASN